MKGQQESEEFQLIFAESVVHGHWMVKGVIVEIVAKEIDSNGLEEQVASG